MSRETSSLLGAVLFVAAVPCCVVVACALFWCSYVRSLRESQVHRHTLPNGTHVGALSIEDCVYCMAQSTRRQRNATRLAVEEKHDQGETVTATTYPLEEAPGVQMLAIPVVELPVPTAEQGRGD